MLEEAQKLLAGQESSKIKIPFRKRKAHNDKMIELNSAAADIGASLTWCRHSFRTLVTYAVQTPQSPWEIRT